MSNVLQYVGGYVPHALLKKYEKLSMNSSLNVLGIWLWKVSILTYLNTQRSGLTKSIGVAYSRVNDITYQLFIAMEKEVQVILPQYLAIVLDHQIANQKRTFN